MAARHECACVSSTMVSRHTCGHACGQRGAKARRQGGNACTRWRGTAREARSQAALQDPHRGAEKLVDLAQQRQLAQRRAPRVQAVHPKHVVGPATRAQARLKSSTLQQRAGLLRPLSKPPPSHSLVPLVGGADGLEDGAVLGHVGGAGVQPGRVNQLHLHSVERRASVPAPPQAGECCADWPGRRHVCPARGERAFLHRSSRAPFA